MHDCRKFDLDDPLAEWKDSFQLPENEIYLDGNSLGALPKKTLSHMNDVLQNQWGKQLIRSWNESNWFALPIALGKKIAPLVGAHENEVVVCDSMSVNLYKILSAATQLRPGRCRIVTDDANFPTDVYIGAGAARQANVPFQIVPAESILNHVDPQTAIVYLSHVDFRTGRLQDMPRVTRQIQEKGALVLWNLAHSAGTMPLQLADWNVDFAIGCGYKYLNGGPGAPAFVYAAQRWIKELDQPIQGWFGHASPFDFQLEYQPHPGIQRLLCGTPPILALAALDASLNLWKDLDLDQIREKAMQLGVVFHRLVKEQLPQGGPPLVSPTSAVERGSQLTYRCSDGYPIIQALIHQGVIGDFRAPDLMRFGFAPLYVGFEDLWDAVQRWRDIMTSGQWRNPAYLLRSAVT